MNTLAIMLFPVLAVLDLSVHNVVVSLIVLIVFILLFVAVWKLIAPYLGQFANLVMVLCIIVVILIVAGIFGIFT